MRFISRHLPVVLFIVVAAVHMVGPATQVTDSRMTVPTAVSLVEHQTMDLSHLATVRSIKDRYDLVEVGGRTVMKYPYPPVLFTLPVVAAVDALPGVNLSKLSISNPNRTALIEVPVASLLTAGAAVLFFATAQLVLTGSSRRRRLIGLLATIAFAFGTGVWSTASRAMWQHTPSVFLLTLALYLAVRSRDDPRAIRWLGVVLGAAITMRPTDAIPLVMISLWVVWCRRSQLLAFALGVAACGAVFAAVNQLVYHSYVPPYYEASKLRGTSSLASALAGTMIAPSRGLLLYAPVLLLVPFGIARRRRERALDGFDLALLATLAAHWVLIASWANWWGGASFGPRLFTDMIPFLMYFVLPILDLAPNSAAEFRRRGIRVRASLVLTLLLASIMVNAQGALVRATFCWNADPKPIDDDPARNWDWSDPQMLRGVHRLLSGDSLSHVIAGSCTGART